MIEPLGFGVNARISSVGWRVLKMRAEKARAVVLLSGGLGSATTAAIALDDGFEGFALSFWYGQRHVWGVEAAGGGAGAFGGGGRPTGGVGFRGVWGGWLRARVTFARG